MKILCIADHIDPLVYSAGIKQRFKDVELVLSAGDLPLSYYDFIMSTMNKPLLFVFGNHNLKGMEHFRGVSDALGRFSALRREVEAPATGAVYLNGRVRREKGLLLAGLDGSRWYNGEGHSGQDADKGEEKCSCSGRSSHCSHHACAMRRLHAGRADARILRHDGGPG